MEDDMAHWFAIRTMKEFEAERLLTAECDDVFLPKEKIKRVAGAIRIKPVVPRLLFIKTCAARALELEARGQDVSDRMVPFWIYRYHRGASIQPISEREMTLFRLLTSDDTSRCELYNRADFAKGSKVRITGGQFEGYIGHVQRIRKNKHVVVEIDGVCAIALPFIHPALLEPLS